MRPLLSTLLLTSGILTARASLQPFQDAHTFDPYTYTHTPDNPAGGYPNITNFFYRSTGSPKWNTESSWNMSFHATFVDTYNPIVTTRCVAYGYVFVTDCTDADFGGDVIAGVDFDLVLNEDQSADLTMVWEPRGGAWRMPECWRQVNITKHFPPGDFFGPTQVGFGVDQEWIWEYRGVDNFLPDQQTMSSAGC